MTQMTLLPLLALTSATITAKPEQALPTASGVRGNTSLFDKPMTSLSALDPDRSGEPALRELLEQIGKLQNVHAVLVAYQCDGKFQRLERLGVYEIWRKSDRVFRVSYNGMWGDASLVIADGQTLSTDTLESEGPVTLTDLAEGPMSLQTGLKPGDSPATILWALLDGPAGFNSLVSAESFIKSEKGGSASFGSKRLGTVQVLPQAGKLPLVRYDQLTNWGETGPSPGSTPIDTVEVETVSIQTNVKFPKNWFDTVPAKGIKVQDQRKKKTPDR